MEAALLALLAAICPRVSPDFAPLSTARPYITWQALGGRSLRWLDGSAADKRHTLLQINTWAASRKDATEMMRLIESAMCASTSFKAWPEGEPISTAEEDLDLYGSAQTFSVYALR